MQKIRVLVAPLDWGLGHATRCLPLINELIKQHCAVWIASAGASGALLQQAYPDLPFLPLAGYRIFYQRAKQKLAVSIALQAFKILRTIRTEHKTLRKLINQYDFDVVISDNRFGCYSDRPYTVFITHQLQIFSGLHAIIDKLLQKMNYHYIQKFDECWIPDYAGKNNLAGELSHPARPPKQKQVYYIGPLSRFREGIAVKKYDLVFVLSGPEPLRTRWEAKIVNDLAQYKGKALIVRGLPQEREMINPENDRVEIKNYLSADALNLVMLQADWVICRSGYSSVMDLVALRKKAILVPTPEQGEQLYLAHYLKEQGLFYTVKEEDLCIPQSLSDAEAFSSRQPPSDNEFLLRDRVAQLLKIIQAKKDRHL